MMGDKELKSSDFEKDIGVIVQRNLRPSLQCSRTAQKANAVLAQLTRAVSYRDKETFLHLYRTYVRSLLDYCSSAWSPWNQGDTEVVEKVQRRAIGMVTNFCGKTYEEKLAEAGMTTLEERRRRGDLLQAFRVLNKVDDVDPSIWFTMARQREDGPAAEATRSATGFMNVKKGEERQNEIRKNFWSQRFIVPWNSIPDQVHETS